MVILSYRTSIITLRIYHITLGLSTAAWKLHTNQHMHSSIRRPYRKAAGTSEDRLNRCLLGWYRPSTRPGQTSNAIVNMAFQWDKNCILLISHNNAFPIDSSRRPRAPPPNRVGKHVPLSVIRLFLNFNVINSRSMTNYINNSTYYNGLVLSIATDDRCCITPKLKLLIW